MIAQFVTAFDAKRAELMQRFKDKRPENYQEIVKAVIEAVTLDEDEAYDDTKEVPDPERIHQIDDGDYQGTLLFVIARKGYQPDTYYAVLVSYGSCSGCDTLAAIGHFSDDPVTDAEANEYLTLALHIVQRLKKIGGD